MFYEIGSWTTFVTKMYKFKGLTPQNTLPISLSLTHSLTHSTIRNDISTNAQTLKHNINNVCNLIKLKQAI